MALGVGAAGQIPGEGRCGMVGQRVGEEDGEVWTSVWGLGWGDAHQRTLSVAVQKRRLVLTGVRPGKQRVAPMVWLERTGASRWSSWVRRRHRTTPEVAGDGEALVAQLKLSPMGKSRGGVPRSTARRSVAPKRGPTRWWGCSGRRQRGEGRTHVEERRGADCSVERGGNREVKPSVFASQRRWWIRMPVGTVTGVAADSVLRGRRWRACTVKHDPGAVHSGLVMFMRASPVNIKLNFFQYSN
jgi:hypothetical protein